MAGLAMSASHWEPFAEIAWRPSNDDGASDRRWFAPAVDIFEDDDAFVVKVELPGMRESDVHVEFAHGIMTIRGERGLENPDRRQGYHRIERSYGAFSRAFALPAFVDERRAITSMEDGVLGVTLPKREPDSASPSSLELFRRAS